MCATKVRFDSRRLGHLAAAIVALLGIGVPPLAARDFVEPRSGEMVVLEADLRLPAGLMSLALERTWREGIGSASLGAGWVFNIEKRLRRSRSGVTLEEYGIPVVFEARNGIYVSRAGDELTFAADGQAVRRRSDGATEVFAPDGRLIQVRRGGGNAVTFEYGNKGALSRVRGVAGMFLQLSRDPSGRVVRVDTSDQAAIDYRYDGGLLAGVSINGGAVTTYRYGDRRLLVGIQRAGGASRNLVYDPRGRVIERRFADGATERYEYDDAARTVRMTDPTGAVTSIRRRTDNAEEEIVDALGRSTRLRYDAAGRLLSATDAAGVTASYSYDASGRLVSASIAGVETLYTYVGSSGLFASIASSDGSRRTFDYDANRQLAALRDGKETLVAFAYTPAGQLASLKRKGDPELRFGYGPEGRLLTQTEVGGRSWRFEYDARGNVITRVDGAGRATAFSYDAQDRWVTRTDPGGAITRYGYDAAGHVSEITNPLGQISRFEHDAGGRLTAIEDPEGHVTRYRYDLAGRLVQIGYPGGATYAYTHDRVGRLVETKDPLGGLTRYRYDVSGHLAAVTDAAGLTWKYGYALPGQLARITGPDGRVTESQFDAKHRRVGTMDTARGTARTDRDEYDRVGRITLPGGATYSFGYDAAGRVSQVASSVDDSTRYEYDTAGRLSRVRSGSGDEVSLQYDRAGAVEVVTNKSGGSLALQRDAYGRVAMVADQSAAALRISYDALGRPTEMRDPLGNVRRLAYAAGGGIGQITEANGDTVRVETDPAGRLAVVRHPGGGATRFTRNAVGSATEIVDPLGASAQFVYDVAGRLTREVDAEGLAKEYRYDTAGRLAEQRLPGGKIVHYRYDAAGRLREVDDGVYPVRYDYDAAGRITHREFPAIGKAVGYEYGPQGLLGELIAPDGRRIRYAYDTSNRLRGIALSNGREIGLGYDARNRLVSIAYPNGIRGTWEWDASDRLVRITYRNAVGVEIDGSRYNYDAAGRVRRAATLKGGTVEFDYDAAGQLTSEKRGADAVRYAYKPGGNRVSRDDNGTVVQYRHNAADQLLEAGAETMAYDRRGNLTERRGKTGLTRYEWDAQSQLVRIIRPDGRQVQYDYSPTGERTARRDADATTHFVTDGVNLLADLDASLAVTALYIHAPGIDRPLAVLRGDEIFFYQPQALGSISSITDARGQIVAAYQMDAFGNLLSSSPGVPNRLLFAAREYEADVGLYFFRRRYYDPSVGRFLSPDPLPTRRVDPIEGNRYVYARNAPTRYVDPLGAEARDPTRPWLDAQALWHEEIRKAPETGFLSPKDWYKSYQEYLQAEHGLTPELYKRLKAGYVESHANNSWFNPAGVEDDIFVHIQSDPLKAEALVNRHVARWEQMETATRTGVPVPLSPEAQAANAAMAALERAARPLSPTPPPAMDPNLDTTYMNGGWKLAPRPDELTAIHGAPSRPVPPPDGIVSIEPRPYGAPPVDVPAAVVEAAALPTRAMPPVEGGAPPQGAAAGARWARAGCYGGAAIIGGEILAGLNEGRSLGTCVEETAVEQTTGVAGLGIAYAGGALGGGLSASLAGGTFLSGAATGAGTVTGFLASPPVIAAALAYGAYSLIDRFLNPRPLPPAELPLPTEAFGRVSPPNVDGASVSPTGSESPAVAGGSSTGPATDARCPEGQVPARDGSCVGQTSAVDVLEGYGARQAQRGQEAPAPTSSSVYVGTDRGSGQRFGPESLRQSVEEAVAAAGAGEPQRDSSRAASRDGTAPLNAAAADPSSPAAASAEALQAGTLAAPPAPSSAGATPPAAAPAAGPAATPTATPARAAAPATRPAATVATPPKSPLPAGPYWATGTAPKCSQLAAPFTAQCTQIFQDCKKTNCAPPGYSGCEPDCGSCNAGWVFNDYWCQLHPSYVSTASAIAATNVAASRACVTRFQTDRSPGRMTVQGQCLGAARKQLDDSYNAAVAQACQARCAQDGRRGVVKTSPHRCECEQ